VGQGQGVAGRKDMFKQEKTRTWKKKKGHGLIRKKKPSKKQLAKLSKTDWSALRKESDSAGRRNKVMISANDQK